MKFNRSEIMKAAWRKHNRHGMDMSTALRIAWMEAKLARPVHQVWADAFRLDAPVMIASGLTFEEARRFEYDHKFCYDRTWIKAA